MYRRESGPGHTLKCFHSSVKFLSLSCASYIVSFQVWRSSPALAHPALSPLKCEVSHPVVHNLHCFPSNIKFLIRSCTSYISPLKCEVPYTVLHILHCLPLSVKFFTWSCAPHWFQTLQSDKGALQQFSRRWYCGTWWGETSLHWPHSGRCKYFPGFNTPEWPYIRLKN